MDNTQALVGIDWGTTNRRAYVLNRQGHLINQHEDHLGMLAVNGEFEPSLKELLRALEVQSGDVIMSGMIGSRNGWREAPYIPVGQPMFSLASSMIEVNTNLTGIRCRIVPGYQFIDAFGTPDVMRGEETQIFGATVLGASDGWYVHPGTHCKWVKIENGGISEIMTFMTGELYALLSVHGTLGKLIQGSPLEEAPPAFEAGLKAAQHGNFTHVAFGCRAMVVTNNLPAAHAASYLSGLLIGSEIASIRQKTNTQGSGAIHVIGSPALTKHYVNALRFFNMPTNMWPPDDVYIAAITKLAELQP